MMWFWLVLFLLPAPVPAQAGAPPSEVIPWDTCWMADTVFTSEDRPVVVNFPILFITRDKYERELLGMSAPSDLRESKRDLTLIKEMLKAKRKP